MRRTDTAPHDGGSPDHAVGETRRARPRSRRTVRGQRRPIGHELLANGDGGAETLAYIIDILEELRTLAPHPKGSLLPYFLDLAIAEAIDQQNRVLGSHDAAAQRRRIRQATASKTAPGTATPQA